MESQTVEVSVVVVGAGAAGISAGRELLREGIDFVILEARNRVGGRAFTDSKLRTPVDCGGSWIHDYNAYNSIGILAKKYGVEVRKPPRQIRNVFCTNGEVERQVLRDASRSTKRLFEIAKERAEKKIFETDVSIAEATKDFYDDICAKNDDTFRKVFDWTIGRHESYEGANTSCLSVYHWDSGEDFNGGNMQIPIGYGSLLEILAKEIRDRIKLETNVVEISHGSQSDTYPFTVHAERGDSKDIVRYRAKAVICTLPLGVLKASVVTFTPPLPPRTQESIEKLGNGLLNKIVLKFRTPFWLPKVRAGFASETKNYYPEFFDFSNLSDGNCNILIGFLSCDFGWKEEFKTDKQIMKNAMDVLRLMFQPDLDELRANIKKQERELARRYEAKEYQPCTSLQAKINKLRPRAQLFQQDLDGPDGYIITRWGSDPFSLGSYSHFCVGSSPRDIEELAEPVRQTLVFAGEHVDINGLGCIHGAFDSGTKQTQKIVRILEER